MTSFAHAVNIKRTSSYAICNVLAHFIIAAGSEIFASNKHYTLRREALVSYRVFGMSSCGIRRNAASAAGRHGMLNKMAHQRFSVDIFCVICQLSLGSRQQPAPLRSNAHHRAWHLHQKHQHRCVPRRGQSSRRVNACAQMAASCIKHQHSIGRIGASGHRVNGNMARRHQMTA